MRRHHATTTTIPVQNQTMAQIIAANVRGPAVVAQREPKTPAPDARRVYEMILAAAERQLATAACAAVIRDAGLESALRDIVQQIAANAANPIADAIEDAIAP